VTGVTYGSPMNIIGTKVTKSLVVATLSILPIALLSSPVSAACTVTIRNTTATDDRFTDTASQIRYEFNWTCSENSGESWAKVSTSNAMIDRAGDVAPSGSGWGIIAYGGGFGGLTSELQASTTYFVQGYAKTSSGTYSSEIIAITTTSAEVASRNTTTTTATTVTPSQPSAGSSSGAPEDSTISQPSTISRVISVTTVQEAIDDDGVEDDFAEISVRTSSGKYDIRVGSSYSETEMVIRARKSGARAIVWNITTSSEGARRILTSRNLSGYTLTLLVDGEVFYRVRVR
jgi:predicted  nucleic acid-binding Zn-ribbon protein